MVSLVLVAHSAQLAEGARELALQMAQGKVAIAAAGGSGDPKSPLGTNAALISSAIQSVCSEDGVLVITDLGSALLSSEMAIELLPEALRGRIRLSACPLVEGATAAAVQAALGSPLDQVEAEAVRALEPKVEHLGIRGRPGLDSAAEPLGPGEVLLAVPNRLGLHARPAAMFVATANRFPAEISVRNLTRHRGPANAKSINQLATLEVRQGDWIGILARGKRAAEATSQLKTLVEGGFGEDWAQPPQAMATLPSPSAAVPISTGQARMHGLPASPGIALGRAETYVRVGLPLESKAAEAPEREAQRFEEALEAARWAIRELQARVLERSGPSEAAILDAHLLCLEDPELAGTARALIFAERISAASAWAQATQRILQTYQALGDPRLRERSADIVDVGRRVSALLLDQTFVPAKERPAPVILLAVDLTPSDVATLDPQRVRGICTVLGGPSSHAAILARAMNLPAVVGLGIELLSLPAGTSLALDGGRGEVVIEPDAEEMRAWQHRLAERADFAQQARAKCLEPAVTRDGHRVVVVANAGSLNEVKQSFRQGAEGIGVLRTEFLFLSRNRAPTEEEQIAIYQEILAQAGARPVVIRTLDAGGDKPVAYLHQEVEANPFLGLRGVRLSLDRPELFKTQLRALLVAGAGHDLRVLLPMVTNVEEVRQVKRMIEEAREELVERRAIPCQRLPVGIMVEVPSAALLVDQFLREVDFISLGTNDLAQYVLAAERGNPALARLSDSCHPAILRLIQTAVQQSHKVGVAAAVCGEMAGDPEVQPLLVGLGVDELSLVPSAIPEAKALVRAATFPECRDLAEQALLLDSAQGVRELVRLRRPSGLS